MATVDEMTVNRVMISSSINWNGCVRSTAGDGSGGTGQNFRHRRRILDDQFHRSTCSSLICCFRQRMSVSSNSFTVRMVSIILLMTVVLFGNLPMPTDGFLHRLHRHSSTTGSSSLSSSSRWTRHSHCRPVTHNIMSSSSSLCSSASYNGHVITALNDDTANVAASAPRTVSTPSEWHKQRRKLMLDKYGDQIRPLETDATSQTIGLPLLGLTCLSLLGLSIYSGQADLPVPAVVALAVFPGSMLSVWQLQILHDVLHGSMLNKRSQTVFGMSKKDLQDKLLFWGSLPSFYGYHLYLKAGHLTHHSNLGEFSLADVFLSDKPSFEDGDVLFVAHRMSLSGDYGPQIPIPSFGNGSRDSSDVTDAVAGDSNSKNDNQNVFKMSISKSGFYFWKDGSPIANAIIFAISFLYERFLLTINEVIVATFGKNLFFWNKPQSFHDDCVDYARVATAVRGLLWLTCGWKSILFLFLSESLWSIPPHPSCAMFVTNHGSETDHDGRCTPSRSTYAGAWYSIFTLGTNFHVEHHDFPTIPFHRLHELRKIAPEFYRSGSDDDLLKIMTDAFAHPQFYACMDSSPSNFAGSHVQQNAKQQREKVPMAIASSSPFIEA